MTNHVKQIALILMLLPVCLLTLAGCAQDVMWEGGHVRPLQRDTMFPDNNSSRPLVADTVARGQADLDTAFYEGRAGGRLVDRFPIPITREVLDRGQERFNIYCSPCHGLTGDANGMIVQRGFSPPPSYYEPRLMSAPVGHFYDVITNGWGAMYSYNDRVRPADRWAIAAYIRALQVSRSATIDDVPPEQRQTLQGGRP